MARRGPRPALRLFALLGISVLGLGTVAGRLVQLQVVKAASFENLAERQRLREVDLPAKRGPILDRNGEPLAMSVEARAIFANPRVIDDANAVAKLIAPIIGRPGAEVKEKLRRDAGFVYLARKVSPAVWEKVRALRIPGVDALPESDRIYPAGTLAGQVLGFVGTDGYGLAGFEAGFDDLLAGEPGNALLEKDPRGRAIPYGTNQVRPPVAGRGLQLTIDRDMQFATEAALDRAARRSGARAGVAIAMDPRSGEVLAMANWPAFDPNVIDAESLASSRNRAVTDVYEPGSVNKVVTAAAVLEAGVATPSTRLKVEDTLRVSNKTFSDYKPHKTETMTYARVLAESSNVGTIKMALKLGKERLYEMLSRFRFGRASGIGFPGEASGLLLPLDEWYSTSIGTIPIGNGVAVTPLQMASVYATIANDGVLVEPSLVRATLDRDGTPVRVPPASRERVVSVATAAQLRGMLVGVVEEGTGRMARLPGYLVAGKTGTARKPRTDGRGYSKDLMTTFVGLAPADKPRLVVLVSLDSPAIRMAALTAAPAFREIVQYALASMRVAPSFPSGGRATPLPALALPPPPRPAPPEKAAATPAPDPRPPAARKGGVPPRSP